MNAFFVVARMDNGSGFHTTGVFYGTKLEAELNAKDFAKDRPGTQYTVFKAVSRFTVDQMTEEQAT